MNDAIAFLFFLPCMSAILCAFALFRLYRVCASIKRVMAALLLGDREAAKRAVGLPVERQGRL